MSEMNKAFDSEFMEERKSKDRTIMLAAMNNVQNFTVFKASNRGNQVKWKEEIEKAKKE